MWGGSLCETCADSLMIAKNDGSQGSGMVVESLGREVSGLFPS